ncbi:Sodium/calcium exchanger NCL2 [Gracilariopsis chorda]|uniref:Sodium/calcium exchanger NCL2 n=1 Tax=Gracilariopsis chorda TaxID=448386 RepID=A0A2V3J0Z2_9FLOR|nr:Sodium/calcium exchanger NCL2 [Gracilariopsis chorda]|eukprot:PXF48054.1 Sodium/calcium exchanger NCL2 [Gracilariopsis chorda]
MTRAAAENGTLSAPGVLSQAVHCDVSPTSGFVQVLMLLCVYGFILYNASQLIAHGSELLLFVPALRDVVGSVVLPILGAVPDGAIVLFSGLGENAQEELSVGVGALAGSTIMLLTVPWFLSILAGRVSIRPDGQLTYQNHHKLSPPNSMSLLRTGVEPQVMVKDAGRVMLLTAGTYLVIQFAALRTGVFFKADENAETTARAAAQERLPAIFCLFVCLGFFAWYLYYQLVPSPKQEQLRKGLYDELTQKYICKREISLTDAFREVWDVAEIYNDESLESETTPILGGLTAKEKMSSVLKAFFNAYDYDNSGSIDKLELQYLMGHLGEHCTADEISKMYKKIDKNGDNQIELEEFLDAMPEFICSRARRRSEAQTKAAQTPDEEAQNSESPQEGNKKETREFSEDEDDHETLPQELDDKDPLLRSFKIMKRAITMMAAGTALVLIFADPMVGVMSEVGQRVGIPAFYISFVLAPLASNASELIAAYSYAQKKTRKTLTISLSTLIGAAIMNNTFVLAIFMILIAAKGLAWQFTAETITILVVELVIGIISQKRVMTLRDGFLVLAIFPLSLILVAVLESCGLD